MGDRLPLIVRVTSFILLVQATDRLFGILNLLSSPVGGGGLTPEQAGFMIGELVGEVLILLLDLIGGFGLLAARRWGLRVACLALVFEGLNFAAGFSKGISDGLFPVGSAARTMVGLASGIGTTAAVLVVLWHLRRKFLSLPMHHTQEQALSEPNPLEEPLHDAPATEGGDAASRTTSRAYAGLKLRTAAILLDGVVIVMASMLIRVVQLAVNPGVKVSELGAMDAAASSAVAVLSLLYFAICESGATGATLGKRVIGICVVDGEGRRASFWQAALRHGARYPAAGLLGGGFVLAAFTVRGQGLHDKLSDCVVVRQLSADPGRSAHRAEQVLVGAAIVTGVVVFALVFLLKLTP